MAAATTAVVAATTALLQADPVDRAALLDRRRSPDLFAVARRRRSASERRRRQMRLSGRSDFRCLHTFRRCRRSSRSLVGDIRQQPSFQRPRPDAAAAVAAYVCARARKASPLARRDVVKLKSTTISK